MIHSLASLAADPDLLRPPVLRSVPCGVAGRTALVTLGPKGGKSSTTGAMLAESSRAGVRGLLVTLDEALPDSVQRLLRYGADPDLVFVTDQFDPDGITAAVESHNIGLLCVDHLGKLAEQHPDFGSGSAGDAVLWGRLIAPFTTLARAYDLAVIILDQARRSDGKYGGSAAKAGTVDYIVELEQKDGGLVAAPRGRTYLAPFRIDLDVRGVPQFTIEGEPGADTVPDPIDNLTEKAKDLLRLLADSEPEGLTSSRWLKLAAMRETTYHRTRRALLSQGFALGPDSTRTRRYRITNKGETWLGEVPTCHGTTTAALTPATPAKPLYRGVGSGQSETPAQSCHGSTTAVPRQHPAPKNEERTAIEQEVAA